MIAKCEFNTLLRKYDTFHCQMLDFKHIEMDINFYEKYASIVIIDGNIPCLVFHRDNPGLDSNKDPIIPRSIRIPFQGENINQIVFKIYETREILDILADDDYQPKYKSPYANCAKMI